MNIAENLHTNRGAPDFLTEKGSAKMPSYKRGGMVRKTGPALVHKGERVIPRGKIGAAVAARMKVRSMKEGMRPERGAKFAGRAVSKLRGKFKSV